MYYNIKDFNTISNKVLNKEYEILNMNDPLENNNEEIPEETEINMPEEDLQPRYPFMEDESYMKNREIELMRELYSNINSSLYPFVTKVLDEFEFIGSPIYSVMGIDRETISQMVDRTINIAEENLDQVGEAKNERTGNYLREWDRWGLLRSTIESLLLNDIFSIRRPRYFRNFAPDVLR